MPTSTLENQNADDSRTDKAVGCDALVSPPSCFSGKTSEWATPQNFFDKLNDEFRFTLDAASTHENAKCSRHYTAEDDGLKQSWEGETVWLNPPYTSGPRCAKVIREWVKKAYDESQRPNGATVVCLVPARTDSAWWHDYALKGEVRFVRGRLKFQGAPGQNIRPVTASVAEGRHAPNNCAPFASAVVIFRQTRPIPMKNNQPKSMHCDWGMMRDETNWDKTDGVAELRGRLDKIREGFEAAIEAPPTHEEKLAKLREASAALKAEHETIFAQIDEVIATHRKP